MAHEISMLPECCLTTFNLNRIPAWIIPVLAWLIPVGISVAAIFYARLAVTRSLRPVLVFVCKVRDKEWLIQNVGTGPALDVLVAEKTHEEQPWTRFKRLPPLSKDGEINLESAPSFFAVTYTDAENNAYSTTCSRYRNQLQTGH